MAQPSNQETLFPLAHRPESISIAQKGPTEYLTQASQFPDANGISAIKLFSRHPYTLLP